MRKKRYCVNGHDTFVYGRTKTSRTCKECERIRNRYENMTEEQIENRKQKNLRKHEEMINNPIRRMRKNALQRIRRFEKGK